MDGNFIVLKARNTQLGKLTGFEIEAHNGKNTQTMSVGLDKLVMMGERGIRIEGAEVYEKQLIVNTELLKSLPVSTKHFVIKEVVRDENRIVAGYVIEDVSNNNSHKIDLKTAWDMSANGFIENMKAMRLRNSGRKVLVRLEKKNNETSEETEGVE